MRRPSAIVGAKVCQRCQQLFMGTPRRKFCNACKVQQMRDSDKASTQRQAQRQFARDRDHLTEAQVDAIFTEALAQIRRERRHEADVSTSQAWKYEEPGR